MKCPLWSIFNQQETECIGKDCGMYGLCRPDLLEEVRPYDVCPNGHQDTADVTGPDTPEGKREMLCLICDARWLVPEVNK
jgi:hypothetical protein